ncbi:6484_t:CDS:2, partial [Cetraspora pellucida]
KDKNSPKKLAVNGTPMLAKQKIKKRRAKTGLTSPWAKPRKRPPSMPNVVLEKSPNIAIAMCPILLSEELRGLWKESDQDTQEAMLKIASNIKREPDRGLARTRSKCRIGAGQAPGIGRSEGTQPEVAPL